MHEIARQLQYLWPDVSEGPYYRGKCFDCQMEEENGMDKNLVITRAALRDALDVLHKNYDALDPEDRQRVRNLALVADILRLDGLGVGAIKREENGNEDAS